MNKILMMLFFISISANAQQGVAKDSIATGFTLEEGTIIKISLDNDISGKELNAGDKINFTTTEDIIQGNYVVLHKGLKVIGTVTEAAKSKGLGKKGKLSFSVDYLYLTNGKVVKLRNDISKNMKGSGAVVAGASVLLSPLALFIKGKNAKYPKGTIFDAFVDEKTTI